MRGAGEAESLRIEPEPWVVTRGRRGTLWVEGGGCVYTELRFVLLVRRPLRGSPWDRVLSGILGDFSLLAFEFGERARLDVSLIQLRSDKRWLMNGCFRRRLGTKPFG